MQARSKVIEGRAQFLARDVANLLFGLVAIGLKRPRVGFGFLS